MQRLWLRNEVFDGVLPLRSTGVPLSPAKHFSSGAGGGPSPLFILLKALREANPDTVRYTTWITEGWRVLQWSEPAAKLFWEMLCMFHCHSPRLGSSEKVPCFGGKDGGDEKVQAIELPVSQLGLFLFLHLHPDSTTHRLTSQRLHNVDSVWPSEEAAAALGGSPRRAGGVHSPGRVGHGRATSPSAAAPSSPRGFGTGAGPALHQMYTASTSPLSPTRTRSVRLHTRTSDEAHRLTFVRRHVHELLRVASSHPTALLATPAALAAAAASAMTPGGSIAVDKTVTAVGGEDSAAEDEPDMSRADFEAMGFLLTGGDSLENERAVGVTLADLCPLWNQPGRSHHDRILISQLAEFVISALTVNEITYPVPPSPASIFLSDSASASGHSFAADEISASNEQPGVVVPVLPSAPLLVNCASRTTVVHNAEAGGPLRDLQVNFCQESYVYVLTAVRFATVLGCKDCTVVIGAAAGMVRVEECERMQLVTCCRRLTVTNSLECIFPVFVATPPVLSGDNRACQFAPYNSCYPRHKAHLEQAGLLGQGEEVPANLWSSPVEASMLGVPSMSADQRISVSAASRGKARSPGSKAVVSPMLSEVPPAILPPEQFYTLAVPVPPDVPGEPMAENPFGLPPEYAAVLQEREAVVESLHRAIRDAGLTPRQHRELEDCIRGRFTEWLVQTGKLRQVLDLVGQAEKSRTGSGREESTPPSNKVQQR